MSEAERLRALLQEALTILEPFSDGPVAKFINQEDYTVMQERIVDWFGVSDFRLAREIAAMIKEALR